MLTPEELDAIVRKAVRSELAKRVDLTNETLMTRAEVAKLLRVNPKVITTWVRKRGLPARKVVGEWRFFKSEILVWQEAQHGSDRS